MYPVYLWLFEKVFSFSFAKAFISFSTDAFSLPARLVNDLRSASNALLAAFKLSISESFISSTAELTAFFTEESTIRASLDFNFPNADSRSSKSRRIQISLY